MLKSETFGLAPAGAVKADIILMFPSVSGCYFNKTSKAIHLSLKYSWWKINCTDHKGEYASKHQVISSTDFSLRKNYVP